MTNLPTFSQIRSTNFTYEDINFCIVEFFIVYKTNEKILQILIKLVLPLYKFA